MCVSRTLKSSLVVEGIGLHTGAKARVEVHPAPARRGRVFLCDRVEIPALVDYVTATQRCTTLGRDAVTIHTVEHLLAALYLAGITNAEIVVDGPEIPALDGSAQEWAAAIDAAGVIPQEELLPVVRIDAPRWLTAGSSHFFLSPAESLTLYAAIAIPDTIAEQMAAGGVIAQPDIRTQMLRARTYGLEREVQALLDAGLAQGGSLQNAVVLTRDGYLNDQVWPDEPAWHKLLDLLGDLALVGAPITGAIVAGFSGHRAHMVLARYLRETLCASPASAG